MRQLNGLMLFPLPEGARWGADIWNYKRYSSCVSKGNQLQWSHTLVRKNPEWNVQIALSLHLWYSCLSFVLVKPTRNHREQGSQIVLKGFSGSSRADGGYPAYLNAMWTSWEVLIRYFVECQKAIKLIPLIMMFLSLKMNKWYRPSIFFQVFNVQL